MFLLLVVLVLDKYLVIQSMNLIFSKSQFFGRIYAFSMGLILLLMSGVFFFYILAAHSGSDYENNLTAVKGASEGAYWAARNAPSNIFGYLLELHFIIG